MRFALNAGEHNLVLTEEPELVQQGEEAKRDLWEGEGRFTLVTFKNLLRVPLSYKVLNYSCTQLCTCTNWLIELGH